MRAIWVVSANGGYIRGDRAGLLRATGGWIGPRLRLMRAFRG